MSNLLENMSCFDKNCVNIGTIENIASNRKGKPMIQIIKRFSNKFLDKFIYDRQVWSPNGIPRIKAKMMKEYNGFEIDITGSKDGTSHFFLTITPKKQVKKLPVGFYDKLEKAISAEIDPS